MGDLTDGFCTYKDRDALQLSPMIFTRYGKAGTVLWRGVRWTDMQRMIQWTGVAIAHQAPFMVHVKVLCLKKKQN